MKIFSTNEQVMTKALEVVNAMFDDNIRFRKLETTYGRRDGRITFDFTLTVNDSKESGSRFSPRSGRRIATACWHVYGEFFDAVAEMDNEAKMIHPNDRHMRFVKDHGWEDRNIGSEWYPALFSESCDC